MSEADKEMKKSFFLVYNKQTSLLNNKLQCKTSFKLFDAGNIPTSVSLNMGLNWRKKRTSSSTK